MWETYVPGASPARTIDVSKELYDAIHQYCEKTDLSIQFLFDSGLYELLRIWGGGTPALEPADERCLQKVRQIFRHNPMPGSIDWGTRKYRIGIKITSERSFQWMLNLENLAILPCFENGIRRIITWTLKEEGFLEKEEIL
jgi:hypothetical protein